MALNPAFNADTTAYTVTTTNAGNTVTATASDANSTIEISKGLATYDNGSRITWDDGENVLTIKVTNGTSSTTYTVTVTKE